MVTFSNVQQAYNRIQALINHTPVMTSRTLNQELDAQIFFKCENFQRVGAFKFRGVCNKLLSLTYKEKQNGVITHSSGNHAQALALASHLLDIKAVIVMPENAPQVKVDATKEYGAKIVRCGNSVQDREQTCEQLRKQHGYTMIHPYDDDLIIAGAGTAALEFIDEVGDLDYMFCPVGGGGLVSGTSITTKAQCPEVKVIAVEPKQADDAYRSFHENKLYPSSYPSTIADGLRTSLSNRTFFIIKQYVDEILTVSEQNIIEAMDFLMTRMKLVVEPSGAVGLAGVQNYNKSFKNKKVGIILSGGNVDLTSLFHSYYQQIEKGKKK